MQDATVDRIVARVAPGTQFDRAVLQLLSRERPTADDLAALLSDADPGRVRAAILYLGLHGTMRETPVLALCLHHHDQDVVRLAEHCLWALWMQAGSPDGNRLLRDAVTEIGAGNFWEALRDLNKLVESEPDFAEAHFQRGLVMASLERVSEAIPPYHQALRFNAYHFGAAGALGHAFVEQGDLTQAVEYYRRALRIHPRLADVAAALETVSAVLARRRASG
jgi:tetratricopeptide (TPR) repeat protein